MFNKKKYITYNCYKKKKIIVILKGISKNNNSQEKKQFFLKLQKSLFVFLSFLPKNLFYKNFLIIQYILGNKIKVIILVTIYITRFGFIDKKFAKIICKKLEIPL